MLYSNTTMLGYLLIPILTQSLMSGAYGFEFCIKRLLDSVTDEDAKFWSYVKVTENCFSENHVTVKVQIPVSLNFSSTNDGLDISIFFANDKKEILRTSLNKTVRGTFFSIPYRMEKTIEGPEIHPTVDNNYLSLEGDFPKAWLPKNCTKISASFQSADGKIYNYYRIRNSAISIPDLMVTEEFESYNPTTVFNEKCK